MKVDNKYYNISLKHIPVTRPVGILSVTSIFLMTCHQSHYFDGELHEPWEMVYVRRGEVDITADDRVYHLSEGALVFHKPMEFHQISTDVPDTEFFVCSFVMSGQQTNYFKRKVFTLSPRLKQKFEDLVQDVITMKRGERDKSVEDCKRDTPWEFYHCITQMECIMLCLLAEAVELAPSLETDSERLYNRLVGELMKNIYDNITINDLARRCAASPSTVKKCFSQHAGCGVHKFFLRIKMRTAIRHLQEGMSVGEVSDLFGFSNPNYFSSVFKREMGVRPSDYR